MSNANHPTCIGCKLSGPTTPLPPPININLTTPLTCASKQTYSTANGDTCDSIALAKSVSAASLFYLNPNLLNCSSVPTGLELCLPGRCDTYTVKSKDEDCVVIGVNHGVSWADLVQWNIALKSDCANIYSGTASPFWGRVICVSQPGGAYVDPGVLSNSTRPGNGDIGGEGGEGDGYTRHEVPPPDGAKVAEGTTKNCGRFIQAQQGVSCPSMVSKRATPMDLFLKANPSLSTVSECDSKLVPGTWYCLNPVYGFDKKPTGQGTKGQKQ